MTYTGRVFGAAVLLFGAVLSAELSSATGAYAQSSSPSSSSPWSNNRPENQYSNKPSFQNGNAGYPGSALPPSEYQPDARSREYYRERTAPMPPLDNGMYSRQANPYCSGEYCGR